jgi:hypothetical protein
MKRECRGALKAFKKMRLHLIGIYFILETDIVVLVAQLNKAVTDLPGSLLTCWIAWMRLFDFEVKFIPGKKNTAADRLLRRRQLPSDNIDEANEVNIDNWIATELNTVSVILVKKYLKAPKVFLSSAQRAKPLGREYSPASQYIARFL